MLSTSLEKKTIETEETTLFKNIMRYCVLHNLLFNIFFETFNV